MAPFIPDKEVQFAQLAVQQRFIVPEQVRSALELYRRYQAAGGEVPSMPRILVGKGWLEREKAEILLRHLIRGEPLPGTAARKPSPPAGIPGLDASEFEELDEIGLEPPGSAIDLPASPAEPTEEDERAAYIKGMGALAVRKDLVKGYQILQVVGEGSMGTVYRAHQNSMDRTVALKVLQAEKTKDEEFVKSFLAEARNAGKINHPNVIRVHEVSMSGDVYYYSMEFVEGQRLDEWADEQEGGRLDPKQAVKIFTQIAGALDSGLRAGVIHREIRPNAIMICDDGQAKLADLGLTRGEETRFLDGENAYYVAPEQAEGKPVDTRADVYSLGCCLFHCLTGEPPFEGGAPKDVLNRRLEVPTPDPRKLHPEIPQELAKVVMKMMARDPVQRYQTPAETAEALKQVSFAPVRKPLPGRGPLKKPLAARGFKRPIGGPGPAKPKSAGIFKPHSAASAAARDAMKRRRP